MSKALVKYFIIASVAGTSNVPVFANTPNNYNYVFGGSNSELIPIELTITFSDSSNVTIQSADAGWWSHTGRHVPDNSNYITGVGYYNYASYYTFESTSSISKGVSSAAIRIYSSDIKSTEKSLNLQFSEVSSSPLELDSDGNETTTTVFDDLVTGEYGFDSVNTSNSKTSLTFSLSEYANSGIESFVSNSGNYFSVGAYLCDYYGAACSNTPPGISSRVSLSDPGSYTFAGGTAYSNQDKDYNSNFSVGALGGTIDVNGHTSTLSGIFSGSGDLNVINSRSNGQVSFTSNNTHTGSVTIKNDAIVLINGSFADSSSLTAQSGSILKGTGVLPTTTIQSGATHAPGNSIGKQTISGNYTVESGGQLQIEIQGPQNDKLEVNGSAIINGTIEIDPFDGGTPFPYLNYEIVNATGGVSFDGNVNQSAISSSLLAYGSTLGIGNDGNRNTLDIQWQPRKGDGVVKAAMRQLNNDNSNQKSTASVLDQSFKNLALSASNATSTAGRNATGISIGTSGFTIDQAAAAELSPEYVDLLNKTVLIASPGQLKSAINKLAPEGYAAFQATGLDAIRQQRELLFSNAGRCEEKGWVIADPNESKSSSSSSLCLFADGSQQYISINGSNGLSSYSSNLNLALFGLQYEISDQWSAGAAYGYGDSNLYGMNIGSSNVRSTNNGVSLYSTYRPDEKFELQANLGYTNFELDGTRYVPYIGNGKSTKGSTSANGFGAGLRAKYTIPVKQTKSSNWFLISPIAGISWDSYQQNGFNETNGGATRLKIDSHAANSLVGTIGAELTTTPLPLFKSTKQTFRPRLSLAYQVDALANNTSTKELTSSFIGAPTSGSMTTQGENGGANRFVVSAGGDLQIAKDAFLYAAVNYQAETNGSQYGYSGGFKYNF